MKKLIISIAVILIAIFSFWFFYLRNARDNRLQKSGVALAGKIDSFKSAQGRFPKSFSEVGLNENNMGGVGDGADALYYQIEADSSSYIIWYGSGVGESVTYHSNTKEWIDP